jgi:hypothetical protein
MSETAYRWWILGEDRLYAKLSTNLPRRPPGNGELARLFRPSEPSSWGFLRSAMGLVISLAGRSKPICLSSVHKTI